MVGIFSGNRRNHHGAVVPENWSEEFDKRVAGGAKVDRNMSGQPRVQDDNGNWFTRDGEACCGCGKNRNYGAFDPDQSTFETTRHANRPTIADRDEALNESGIFNWLGR